MPETQEIEYAELVDRIKAVFTDMVVYVILIYSVTSVFSTMEDVPQTARILAFVGIFGVYDPLFTSLFGGTLGHLVNGLRVKRDSNLKRNVIFPLAVLRFIVKTFLGAISLFTVSANSESKAIHDLIAGSVVLKK